MALIDIHREMARTFAASVPQASEIGFDLWEIRCPICGDSKKNPNKRRLRIHEGTTKDGKSILRCWCHNCNTLNIETRGMSIDLMLKRKFSHIYQLFEEELRQEWLSSTLNIAKPNSQTSLQPQPAPSVVEVAEIEKSRPPIVSTPPVNGRPETLINGSLIRMDLFAEAFPDHKLVNECTRRQVPLGRVYSCLDTRDSMLMAGGDTKLSGGLESIALPHFTHDYSVSRYQFRMQDDIGIRYLSHKVMKVTTPFGLETVAEGELPDFVVEGGMDSMMFDGTGKTCIGAGSLALTKYPSTEGYIFDNEPRHTEVIAAMKTAIDAGLNVVISDMGWDSRYKDLNDLIIKGGWSKVDMVSYLSNHCYKLPVARLKFFQWKR